MTLKKFTYEITVEANNEAEADSKMRGLYLLTSCAILPKQASVSTLTKQEEKLIGYYRKGEKLLQILNYCLQNPSALDEITGLLTQPKSLPDAKV